MNVFKLLLSLLFLLIKVSAFSQLCDAVQELTSGQMLQLEIVLPQYELALVEEDLNQIDNLSNQLIAIFGDQAGWPEIQENYVALNPETEWLNKEAAVLLSRQLIDANLAYYSDLWKMAKGMKPPDYFPHSLFLRAAAEISVGLLKIAQNESDPVRKELYKEWATHALDSLATMQLESGAFPFPDLRPYNDPIYSEIIQDFLDALGPDSVLALQDGWIIDDFGTGEFKFDAGVCGGAFAEAWLLIGNESYKTIAIATADYLLPLTYNANSNYNTFSAYGLMEAFKILPETNYNNHAVVNLRFSVLPLQISSGRWADGHNARSIYRNIIITNSVPVMQMIDSDNLYRDTLELMMTQAIRDMVEQTYQCGASTGFDWLLTSYQLDESIIPNGLKDSIADLIGNYMNTAAVNGAYLDVSTMGMYFDLLDFVDGIKSLELENNFGIQIYPNPFQDEINISINLESESQVEFSIYELNGRLIKRLGNTKMVTGEHLLNYQIGINNPGVYLLFIKVGNRLIVRKLIKR
jgi:hypothetical protein